jgi:putrescine aminotransferase
MDGEGNIRDIDGKSYIDCAGGYGVFSLGHRHPEVIQAVKEQLDKMAMSSKLFFSRPLAELCRLLAEITPGDLTVSVLCNSGAEAVEGALKIAMLATRKNSGQIRYIMLVMEWVVQEKQV